MKRVFLIATLIGLPTVGRSQPILDRYVESALRDNLGRQAAEADRVAAAEALSGARRGYAPSLDLAARYTRTSGQTLNLGDFVNPAYAALNGLIGSDRFPTDLDLSLPLRQETTVRLTQPVFQPAISAGVRLNRSRLAGATATERVRARDAATATRTAYVTYLKAVGAVAIYDAALPLLDENLRVSRRLVDAGSATDEAVFRAIAERSAVDGERISALRDRDAARMSFNLGLNRALDEPIEPTADSLLVAALGPLPDEATALSLALSRREELQALTAAVEAERGRGQLARAAYLPGVSVALDYGFQGRDYDFSPTKDYAAASVVLNWNLFAGGRDRTRVREAQSGALAATLRRTEVEQAIGLEVRVTRDAVETARTAVTVARDGLAAARSSYRLVARQYAAGSAPQIALLDARSRLTRAELDLLLRTYDGLVARYRFDRAIAAEPLLR